MAVAPKTIYPSGAGTHWVMPISLLPFDPNMSAVSGAGAAVSITLAADANVPNIIGRIFYSYTAAPTGGQLTIQDVSGTTVFQMAIVAGGPGVFDFEFMPPCNAVANSQLIVTLAGGGGSIVGSLYVQAYKQQ